MIVHLSLLLSEDDGGKLVFILEAIKAVVVVCQEL